MLVVMSLELEGSVMQAPVEVQPFEREIAEEEEEAAAAAGVEDAAALVEEVAATVEVVTVEAAGAEKICIA